MRLFCNSLCLGSSAGGCGESLQAEALLGPHVTVVVSDQVVWAAFGVHSEVSDKLFLLRLPRPGLQTRAAAQQDKSY